jgi:uncharacterized membrane protein
MYLTLKLLHVLAAVAFLGNITLGLFWQAQAARTRDPKLIAFTLATIQRSDAFFTRPGAMLLLLSGFAMAWLGGFSILGTGWLLWGIVLVLGAGGIYGALAGPVRRQMLELAQSGSFSPEAYDALSARFHQRVAFAWLLPFAALALMVFKPS